MSRPNLLRIDDQLIRLGSVFAVVWLVASIGGVSFALNDGVEWSRLIAGMGLFAAAPIAFWTTGGRLRKREQRAWALHQLIEDYVEIPVSDLLRDSDFTKTSLSRAIRDLNNSGWAFLVWDRTADLIQDGRLRAGRIRVEKCGACGAKVSLRVSVGDLESTRCPYCQDFIGAESLIEEKALLIDELRTDPAILNRRSAANGHFSIAIFCVLTFVFWPLGIGYAFWHWRAGQLNNPASD